LRFDSSDLAKVGQVSEEGERLARQQIALAVEGAKDYSEGQESNCGEEEGFDKVNFYGIHC